MREEARLEEEDEEGVAERVRRAYMREQPAGRVMMLLRRLMLCVPSCLVASSLGVV